jgi:hypothetical protein
MSRHPRVIRVPQGKGWILLGGGGSLAPPTPQILFPLSATTCSVTVCHPRRGGQGAKSQVRFQASSSQPPRLHTWPTALAARRRMGAAPSAGPVRKTLARRRQKHGGRWGWTTPRSQQQSPQTECRCGVTLFRWAARLEGLGQKPEPRLRVVLLMGHGLSICPPQSRQRPLAPEPVAARPAAASPAGSTPHGAHAARATGSPVRARRSGPGPADRGRLAFARQSCRGR